MLQKAPKEIEEQMRNYAPRAIKAAKDGDEAEAEKLLSIMRAVNDKIAQKTKLISSIYQETQKIIQGE